MRRRRLEPIGSVALVAGALALGCVHDLPEDPDGAPGLARDMNLGVARRDSLECPRNDCSDWFRIYISGPGTLELEAESADPASSSSVELLLGDDRAYLLDRTRWTRRGTLRQSVDKGYYFVRLSTEAPGTVRYTVRAAFEPLRVVAPRKKVPKDPPPPRYTAVAGQVVEVEGPAGRVDGVLFRVQRADRLRTGLRGRLLQGRDVIGEVEVTEIYSGGGARAKLVGPLRARIDATTKIVIDVPVGSR